MNDPDNNPIRKTHGKAEWKGYNSKLDLLAVRDEFFQILADRNLGECTISKLEVALDIHTQTFRQASQMQLAVSLNCFRKWERARFMYYGEDGSFTDYIGKKFGKFSANYNRSYNRDSKLVGQPVFHFEFALCNWAKIKPLLKIYHPSQCPPAEELFSILERKYISFPTINKKRRYKEFRKSGLSHSDALKSVERLRNVYELRDSLKKSKDNILRKKMFQTRGPRYWPVRNITAREKEILGWSITRFLDFSAGCNNISTFIENYFN